GPSAQSPRIELEHRLRSRADRWLVTFRQHLEENGQSRFSLGFARAAYDGGFHIRGSLECSEARDPSRRQRPWYYPEYPATAVRLPEAPLLLAGVRCF